MAISLSGFRAYGHYDPDDSDPSIELAYNAAIRHALDSGLPEFLVTSDNDKFAIYIYAVALHFAEKRNGIGNDAYVAAETAKMRRELRFVQEPEPEPEVIDE